ncbi:MAG: hypothetical protein ACLUE2_20585 [Bacteroides cellulosilyticus]
MHWPEDFRVVITVQRSGEPGSDMANMYIRGISTFGSIKVR